MSKSLALIALRDFIYGPALKQLHEKLQRIVFRYKLASPDHVGAFLYKGVQYTEDGYRPVRRVPLLRGELTYHMDEWLKEHQEIHDEINRSTNILSCAVSLSRSKQSLLPLIPDCLHPALKNVPEYSGTSPVWQGSIKPDAFAEIKKRLLLNLIT